MRIAPGTHDRARHRVGGLIKSTGLSLPNCLAVAKVMPEHKTGDRIRKALAELDEAMAAENAAISTLEAELSRCRWWQHKREPEAD